MKSTNVLFVLALFSLLTLSTAIKYWLYIGAGGCDSDDPTCVQPPPVDRSTLYITTFDSITGIMSPVSKVVGLSPNWIHIHPNGKYLYTVSNIGVASFLINSTTGSLVAIDNVPTLPAVFLDINPAGTLLFIASYGTGSVSICPISDDGRIRAVTSTVQFHGHGPNKDRQEAPHPHSINVDPKSQGRFVMVPDLGLDTVFSFNVQSGVYMNTSYTSTTMLAPGGGPRHMAFHPTLAITYVVSEMGSTISVLRLDSTTGAMAVPPLQVISTIPADFTGFNKAAEVVVHPSGNWLFASNRGLVAPSNSITVYKVDGTGLLTVAGRYPSGGRTPRGVALSPEGTILICGGQDSNNVASFSFDSTSGVLTPTGFSLGNVATPVAFAFVPVTN